MSTASEKKFIPEPSQGDYWGGYMVDSWIYKLLALFPITGLLGIDQLALRSPLTAFLKLLVNIFFWGAWYVYDIIQITMDSNFVANYGMSTPYGPRGHGYKLFKDLTEQNINEFATASPFHGGVVGTFLFTLYSFLTILVGFTGIPSMIVGDFYGGLLKLFTCLFLFPFYIIGSIIDFFTGSAIEKLGVPRAWPLYPGFMLMKTHPATYVLPSEESKKQMKLYTQGLEALVKDGKQAVVPGVINSAVSMVWEALGNAAPIAAFQTIGAGRKGIQAASDLAQTTVTALQKKLADPKAADKLLDKFLGSTETTIPIQVTETIAKQTGGALVTNSSSFDTILFGGMLVLVLGGFAAAFFRKISLPKRKDDREYPRKTYERNDAPPLPGGI